MIIHYLYDYITITDPYRYMNILIYMLALADEKQYWHSSNAVEREEEKHREKKVIEFQIWDWGLNTIQVRGKQ